MIKTDPSVSEHPLLLCPGFHLFIGKVIDCSDLLVTNLSEASEEVSIVITETKLFDSDIFMFLSSEFIKYAV